MEVFEATFQGGLNSDVDPRSQPTGTYRKGQNITITGLGTFTAAQNLKGTDVLSQLSLGSGYSVPNILGAFDCIVEDRAVGYGGVVRRIKSMCVFVYYKDGSNNPFSRIYLVSTEYDTNNTTQILYSNGVGQIDITTTLRTNEGNNALNFPADGSIDAVVFGEKNYSNIYFTDYENVMRKVTCIVNDTITWNSSTRDISLLRQFPLDKHDITSVEMGGDLPSGSYQIFYRYYNQAKNKYSTFSLATNPVPVYPQDYTTVANKEQIYGGFVNENTGKQIGVLINHTAAGQAEYTHVQLCVAKNINGSKEIPLVAYLTPPTLIASPTAVSSGSIELWKVYQVVGTGTLTYNGVTYNVGEQFIGTLNTSGVLVTTYSGTATAVTGQYVYSGNEQETEIELKEVVVDTAPIQTVKTLETRNNILFGGNVKYFDRSASSVNATVSEVTVALGNNAIYQPTQNNTDKGTITTTATQMAGGGFALVPSGLDVYVGASGDKASLFTDQFYSLSSVGLVESVVACYTGLTPITRYNEELQPLTLGGTFKVGNVITINVQRMVKMLAKGTDAPGFSWQGQWWWNIDQNNRGNIQNYGVATTISYTVTSENIKEIRDGLFQFIQDQAPVDYAISKSGDDTILIKSIDFLEEDQTNVDASCQPVGAGTVKVRPMTKVSWSIDFGQNSGIDTTKTGLGGYKNPLNTTRHRGYFRGEVYRFARVYHDIYGNWSYPVNFQISGGTSNGDWKFSSRSSRPILDDQDNVRALGLNIQFGNGSTAVHPSWAKGMAIVRVKRIKNLIFQSPHVPLIGVQPNNKLSLNLNKPLDGTFAPKKLMTGAARNLLRRNWASFLEDDLFGYAIQNNEGSQNGIIKGSAIYPPEYLYQYNSKSFYDNVALNSLTLKVVDAMTSFMTYQFVTKTTGLDLGNKDQSSLGVAFRSDSANTYYYYWNVVKTALASIANIGQYLPASMQTVIKNSYYALEGLVYPNLAEYVMGTNINMAKIDKYNALEDVSLANKGDLAAAQKSILLVLDEIFGDLMFMNGKPVSGSLPSYIYNTLQFSSTPDTYRHWYETISATPPTAPYQYSDYRKSRYNDTKWDNIVISAAEGTAFTTAIVNVERGLPDDRYGSQTEILEYVYTGTYVPITSTTQQINVNVFGGDCFITKHNIKVNDTHFGSFIDGNVNSDQDYTNAVTDNYVKAYPDMAEVLSCYVESEVNTDLCADRTTYPVENNNSLSDFNGAFLYNYNFGYSAQNYLKSWFSKDPSQTSRTDFIARIVISNQKVYNTNIEGFDTFGAASYYDMDESYLGITKLIRDYKNAVYCLQERAVSDLLVGKRLLQDGDGNATVTYSNTLITEPQFILNTAGCQHIRSVSNSNESIFWADIRNRCVYKIGNGKISETGLSSEFFNRFEANTIAEKTVFGVYDFNKLEYILGLTSVPTNYVFSDRASLEWISEITIIQDVDQAKIYESVFSNKNLFIFGNVGNNFNIERMYVNNNRGFMLNKSNPTYIEVVVNPQVPLSKVFDTIMLDATEKADSITVETYNPVSPYPQQTIGVITQGSGATANLRQTMFNYPIGRDANSARARGDYMLIKLTFNSGNTNKAITKIGVKYRKSERNY